MNSEFIRVLDYYHIQMYSDREKVICPFHADKNASMLIDVSDGKWKCFGCERWGNAFDFHKEYQKQLGNNDSLKILKLYRKIIKNKGKSEDKLKHTAEVRKDAKYFLQMLVEAKDYYHCLSTVDWKEEECDIALYMNKRGFKPSMLNKAGAKLSYNRNYPIVFPIYDNGKFKGWVSRTDSKEIEAKRKYLYNTGFRRRYTLAGDYHSDTVLIVEGYMDMLKAKQLGVKNVVALLGWKITKFQISKLKDAGVRYVISALDNDECGRKGTKELRKHFKVIRFPYPKHIKDMGDMKEKQFVKSKMIVSKRLKSLKDR